MAKCKHSGLECTKEKCESWVVLQTPTENGKKTKPLGRCSEVWMVHLVTENTGAIYNLMRAIVEIDKRRQKEGK